MGTIKKSTLVKLIREVLTEEKRQMNESKVDKIYIEGNTLWSSYAPDSGNTRRLKGNDYITTKKDDKNFDTIATHMMDWSNQETPLKKTSKGSLYKIPVYSRTDLKTDATIHSSHKTARNYSIWGGRVEPMGHMWATIIPEQDYYLISFFKKKNEALYWIKPQK